MNYFRLSVFAVVAVLSLVPVLRGADDVSREYRVRYDRGAGRPTPEEAASEAKKRFIKDELNKRLAPNLVEALSERIDSALDMPDRLFVSLDLTDKGLSDDETERVVEVDGEVDIAAVIGALVQKRALTFGDRAPKIALVAATQNDYQQRTSRNLRARLYEKIRQAGLQLVADVPLASTNVLTREERSRTGRETRSLTRQAKEYGADYLVAINTEVDPKAVLNGYVTHVNLTYTISRPNGDKILGETTMNEHSSGVSQMIAFDKALDKLAPKVALRMTGELFEAIFSDSDLITSSPQLRQEKSIVVNWASAQLVQSIIGKLQQSGADVKLGTGVSTVSSRLKVETQMDDLELYRFLNGATFFVGGQKYTTPVVAYSENVIEVEAVAARAVPRKKPAPAPQPSKPRPQGPASSGPALLVNLREKGYNR